ncbi:CAF17-like 4Fe-4S cluster assembly/insertion protein YgfZ [Moraxella oblonga]|uniref:CAF17-like 4Fe-4S cluster assembly/insertion protein YgfZ n=1 Tax=Moraxella oblonga TaxID=200413 RepID=UPI0009FBF002|nr:folate-binding Fe/S cluster repair protein [Moraxella oblonga]
MNFTQFTLSGVDADKFLQGQLTASTTKITDQFLATAICNLKGRVAFGLWIKRVDDGFDIVLSDDLADDFKAHIKKYGAFSKITLSDPAPIYPCVVDGLPTFLDDENDKDWVNFAKISLTQGNYWLTKATAELFQPQELRLHQRGGVDYDKGCYLGQEIVARLWFKASPKAWLHLITQPNQLSDKIQVVCQFDHQALVIARPDDLADVEILPMMNGLNESVARTG